MGLCVSELHIPRLKIPHHQLVVSVFNFCRLWFCAIRDVSCPLKSWNAPTVCYLTLSVRKRTSTSEPRTLGCSETFGGVCRTAALGSDSGHTFPGWTALELWFGFKCHTQVAFLEFLLFLSPLVCLCLSHHAVFSCSNSHIWRPVESAGGFLGCCSGSDDLEKLDQQSRG